MATPTVVLESVERGELFVSERLSWALETYLANGRRSRDPGTMFWVGAGDVTVGQFSLADVRIMAARADAIRKGA